MARHRRTKNLGPQPRPVPKSDINVALVSLVNEFKANQANGRYDNCTIVGNKMNIGRVKE